MLATVGVNVTRPDGGFANQIDFNDWRAQSLWEGITALQLKQRHERRQHDAACTIQRMVRGRRDRRRYLRHRSGLAELLSTLQAERQQQAAVILQAATRRHLACKRLQTLQEEEEQSRATKSNPRKRPDVVSLECLEQSLSMSMSASPSTLSLPGGQRHFLVGLAAFQSFQYVDAIASLERHLRRHQKDAIAIRLLHRAQAGRSISTGETPPPTPPPPLPPPRRRTQTPPLMLPGVPIMTPLVRNLPGAPSSKPPAPSARSGSRGAPPRAHPFVSQRAAPIRGPSLPPPPTRAPRAVSLPRLQQKGPNSAPPGPLRPSKAKPKGITTASGHSLS
eukprot:TRINITY_DN4948_c0_g1_i1.p1 TRINITY_DN4948_c0_g1~~TRINITY_DN4948_c0_g1_i1.p1  ORF type:complete len:359 (+),score=40.84 TRINITY_DN4948_c0_g1_i1:78-1079(+)